MLEPGFLKLLDAAFFRPHPHLRSAERPICASHVALVVVVSVVVVAVVADRSPPNASLNCGDLDADKCPCFRARCGAVPWNRSELCGCAYQIPFCLPYHCTFFQGILYLVVTKSVGGSDQICVLAVNPATSKCITFLTMSQPADSGSPGYAVLFFQGAVFVRHRWFETVQLPTKI